MATNFQELQNEISKATVTIAESMVEKIDLYLSSFDKKDIFSFASEKARVEEYTEKYFLFLIGISDHIKILTDLNAKVASLLIAADKVMEIDVVVLAEKRLYAFDDFEHNLYDYTSTTEKSLLESAATTAFLVNKAQKFKSDVKKLIDANT